MLPIMYKNIIIQCINKDAYSCINIPLIPVPTIPVTSVRAIPV